MLYLNNLKDDRLYKNIKLYSINKEKNVSKNDCILVLGNNNSMINLLNSNLFSKTNYKHIYTRRTISYIRKDLIDINSYYKDIKNKCNRNIIFKKNLSDYKSNNLFYNLNNDMNTFFKYNKKSGLMKLNDYIDYIVNNILEVSKHYKNLVLYIPIDINQNIDSTYFSLNKLGNDNIKYMYQILKKDNIYNEFKEKLKDINLNIIFHDTEDNVLFKIDLQSENTKRNKCFTLFKTLIKLNTNNKDNLTSEEKNLIDNISNNVEEDLSIDSKKIKKSEEVVNSIKKNLNIDKRKLTNKEIDLIDKINEKTLNVINDKNVNSNKSILNELENNEEFKKYLLELTDIQNLGSINQERVKQLKEKQNEIKLNSVSIKDIINDYNERKIDTEVIDKPDLIFDNVRQCNLKDFDDSYMKKEMQKDTLKVVSSFNEDEDVKMFIEDIKEEVTSTDLTKKKTLSITYKDERNVKHNVKIDMPIIKDGKYVYINGSRKLIQKQNTLLPIVKTAPDTVQITFSYNKFFVKRFGRKLSEKIDTYKRFLLDENLTEYLNDGIKIKLGDCSNINSKYSTNILYDCYSEFIMNIETETDKFLFNYEDIITLLKEDNNIKFDKKLAKLNLDTNNYQMFGYSKDKNIAYFIKLDDGKIVSNDKDGIKTISDDFNSFIANILANYINENGKRFINSLGIPKSLTYSRISITNKKIPLIVILGYEKGLIDILNRYKVTYVFTDENKRPNILNDNVSKIKFNDGYLYYDNSKIRNSLLLSGLSTISTEEYSIKDFEKNGMPYIEYFNNAFGSRNTGKGIHNTLSLMVDNINKEILEELALPTNIIDILLYANTLLEDNKHTEISAAMRIRGAEQVNALLYKILADSFKVYKDTLKNGNPIKMSVPQDILLKKLVELPTVDEYSTLNPSLEIEKSASATYKGIAGINMDDAYTNDIRAYNENLLGVFGYASPDSSKVGMVRYISYNPCMKNTRGFIDNNKETIDYTKDIYTTAELMNPFTSRHADPPRENAIHMRNHMSKLS